MQYISKYRSPLGSITIACDENGISGLWFDGQKYFGSTLSDHAVVSSTPVLHHAQQWLDIYFSGSDPCFTPPLSLKGTEFQTKVWKILLQIPYGKTVSYGEIATRLCGGAVRGKMSAQAVGGAVSRNPVSIIVPCHRVVGTNGSLTGYAGGIDKKAYLLTLEKADKGTLKLP